MSIGGPISFSGLSSGLDIQSIVAQLMKIERRPLDALQQRKAAYQKGISTLGELDSAASKLRASAQKLASSAVALGKTVTTGDQALFTASALSTALAGTHTIRVNTLATTAKMASGAVADRNVTSVGAGTFTIQVGTAETGTTSTDIEFGGGTLEDLRAAIQSSAAGVAASIVHDGSGDRLILSAKQSGLRGQIQVVNGLSGGDVSLSFSTTVAAADASVEIDGIPVTSSSNRLTGAISGVTLDLKAADPTKSFELKIENDKEALKTALHEFADSYNAVKKLISEQGKRGASLAGDPILTSLENELRALVGGTAARGLGRYETLAQIGFKTGRDGSLSLDDAALAEALDASPEDVARLLRLSAAPSNAAVTVPLVGSAKPGTYAVEITQAATRGEWTSGQVIDAQDGLGEAETLSFTAGSLSASVELAQGDKIAEVVSKINTALSSAGIKLTASSSGGALRLRTDLYGSTQSFTVVSDVADVGSSTGIGTSVRTAAGTDVAGTIGGHAALGSGQVLAGLAGTDVEGLEVRVNAAAAGSFGTVRVGGGVMNAISKKIEAFVRTGTGATDTRKSGLQRSIRSLDLRIDQMTSRLDRREEALLRQFLKADEAMGQLNSQLGGISSQLSGLARL
jgi:flagellar hook-associated protein 2